MNPIRVYGVDRHPLFLGGVRGLLESEPGWAWVGESACGSEAVRDAAATAPDVLLVDLRLREPDGVAVIEALRPQLPAAHFVVLSCVFDAADVRRAIAAGACGFLVKTATAQELLSAIRTAHAGRRVFSAAVGEALAAHPRGTELGADLTQRERNLLALMAQGLANHEISAQLAIAVPTVKFHVTNILSKLHAENRTAAVLAALKHRIVCLD